VIGAPTGVYSAATIERGRQLAALGNCEHCHTAEGGLPWAGGRPVETPFGTVRSTNLTADVAHGLGAWSYPAFERAMRQGVSRDGHWLYPAFPYTSFTQASDADLTALYAYLQTLAPVAQATPAATMRFPFNQRWLMAGWNALWLQAGPAPAVPGESAQWQRGAELVNGLGHCTACHSPRGALGAEQASTAYLAGARVNGWDAPPLGALSRSPVPWTEAALVQYLRQGHHAHHGVAGGSMAPVVRGLAAADEADVRAMAHYLVSLQAPAAPVDVAALLARASAREAALLGPAQRMFQSACGACHHDGDGPQVLGLNHPLALNANLHSSQPDNLLRVIIEGIWQPAFNELGHMPAFGHALDDRQLAELAAYMRQRFAPGQAAWPDLPAAVARVRAALR
jgi:nicotinate dehydrogenase subunit B